MQGTMATLRSLAEVTHTDVHVGIIARFKRRHDGYSLSVAKSPSGRLGDEDKE